jgi:DNA polymerase-3 subunit alpha
MNRAKKTQTEVIFDCGCKFPLNDHGQPIVSPEVEDMSLTCPATWKILQDGNTKGVFQLESNLGRSKAKQLKPEIVEGAELQMLADLSAILRPGSANVLIDDKSVTQHYIDCKNGKETVEYYHPDLEPILNTSYGQMIYQEQAMRIAVLVAGFNLQQADNLRKAIGKKKVDLMAKVKEEFLEGAKKLGDFTEKDAKEIFRWIEQSQKYSFNASHSVSYAHQSYPDAYMKAHFPKAFFTSNLRHSVSKPKPFEEVTELVNNARLMDIDIMPPCVLNMNSTFKLINDKPTFGICNIKNVGPTVLIKMKAAIKKNDIDLSSLTWCQFLMKFGLHIQSDSFKNMISAGALDCYNVLRNEMLFHYGFYSQLTKTNKTWLENNACKDIVSSFNALIENIFTRRRHAHTDRHVQEIADSIQSILNPPYKIVDMPGWIAQQENELLGISLTCTELAEYDTFQANCTCKEFTKGFSVPLIKIAGKVERISEYKTKNGQLKGKPMAFVDISDETCMLGGTVIFADNWSTFNETIKQNELLLFMGTRDRKTNESFIINNVKKLKRCV